MKPGDEFAEAWVKRAEELEEIAASHTRLTAAEQSELDALRVRAQGIAAKPEVVDDASTLFVDESRRPNLDGSDYNDTLKAMCCDEVEAVLLKGLKVLGDVTLKALIARVVP